MLSTEFSIGLALFSLIFLGYALLVYRWMLKLANFCRDAVALVQNQNKRSVSLAKLAELDAALTELTDAYDALHTSNKKLRARIGMREVRSRRANGQDEVTSGPAPADEAARAAYKSNLRAKLQKEGRL